MHILIVAQPMGLRRWFKGADTTVLARYLQNKYNRVLADFCGPHEHHLVTIYEGMCECNAFLSGLYHQPLWILPSDAWVLATHAIKFLESHNKAASYALHTLALPRFKTVPKVHMLAHFVHDLYEASYRQQPLLNFLSYSCQLDEDFIGRIAFQSRQVSVRTVHYRTLQRFLVNLAIRW